MEKNNRSQVMYFVIGILILILVFTQLGEVFLYRDSGIVDSTFYDGPTLYLHLSDGRVFEAGKCRGALEMGNLMEFTAVNPPRQGPGPSVPVIIRCKFKGWVLGTPLPD